MRERYRALKRFRWGGRTVAPGEIIEAMPGRDMAAMVSRRAAERVLVSPAPQRPPASPEGADAGPAPVVAKKPRGRSSEAG